MKEKYLRDLEERLKDYQINHELLNEIIKEYEQKILFYEEKGLTDQEIYKLVGDFREQVNVLADKHSLKLIDIEPKNKSKLVALTPFVALILFFILGFGFDLWNPGWLVFLLIPMVAIIVNVFHKEPMNALIAISPFIVVTAYLSIGFILNVWHPTWLVFLLIPMMGIFSGFKTMRFVSFLTAISPFVSLIAYILLGNFLGLWGSAWVVFYLVPIFGVLHEKNIFKLILFEVALVSSALIAFYTIQYTSFWPLSLLAILLPVMVFIIFGEDSILRFNLPTGLSLFMAVMFFIIYILTGIYFQAWAYMWMIFLIIPMYEIIRQNPSNFKYVSIMPFVAVIIFFSLGYFLDLWYISWLAFLLIPVAAIIES